MVAAARTTTVTAGLVALVAGLESPVAMELRRLAEVLVALAVLAVQATPERMAEMPECRLAASAGRMVPVRLALAERQGAVTAATQTQDLTLPALAAAAAVQ